MKNESLLKWPLDASPAWRAVWIAPAGVSEQKNVFFRARRSWTLGNVPRECLLHVAAESRYRVYVNGLEVGLGPVRGTRMVTFYDSYEISNLLRIGENWIAIAVHSPNQYTFKAAPLQPGVLIQIGDGEQVASDVSWEVQSAADWRQDVRMYTFQIGFLEWHDLSLEPEGWQIGADGAEWQTAIALSVDEKLGGKALRGRDIPGLREDRYYPTAIPVTATVPKLDDLADPLIAKRMSEEPHLPFDEKDSFKNLLRVGSDVAVLHPSVDGSGVVIIFDFDREINGGFEIDIEGMEGAIVDIAYDECLKGERLPVIINSYAFADRYILKSGRQIVGSVFAERGYRMVQVVFRNFTKPLKIHSVRGINRTYPFVERGTFFSSDALLNDIWKVCADTINACATDTFVDCPWRENAFYLNDMVVENATSLQAFGDFRFNARCFRLAASQVRPDGLIPAPAPYGILPGKTDAESADNMTLLAASLFLPRMLEEYLLYSGDLDLVRELIDITEGVLERFSLWEDEKGLVCPPKEFWNFVDWSYEISNVSLTGRNTSVMNWFYVQAIDSLVRLFKYLGDSRDSAAWEARARRVSASTDQRFWDDQKECYIEWVPEDIEPPFASQLSQAAALLSGRFPKGRLQFLKKTLLREDLLAPELYMQHYLLRALSMIGRQRDALESIRSLWGPIVLSGSRTIWECGVHLHGKPAYGGAGSICHGFSTAPIDFLQGTILGVRPTSPGFARCVVAPNCLDLEYAKGSIPTPMGNLEIQWEREGFVMTLEMRIPQGVNVELYDGRTYGPGKHQVECAIAESEDDSTLSMNRSRTLAMQQKYETKDLGEVLREVVRA